METNQELQDRIASHPSICGGKPVIRGTSIRVLEILDMIFLGFGFQDILSEYPNLEKADIDACLEYASTRLHSPILEKVVKGLPDRFSPKKDRGGIAAR
ncbi:DUF433 domain-containing protein [Leptospira wolffii]|uniref:Uncharacterized protein n=1 Tax=Leptospira wolffii TaxID=409998 RepID=A0A2M9ZEG1_9LEPT|nr:DUF433 domain-containing protein [Leptospira wolffii]PJZ66831.1 hypothetical protein CH371_01650 [Leptospira wolffii]TGK61803.1 DUF433 domain-containing protein [Leptospira wolffii]TGK65890.1 DUF433 domain-containing protein [Leptospira wolffii]TGK74812.1 DUF433 domain-containing protein [Leptospira wolffii]TGL30878.1 DUF433 domain-containing protein [Leptospira wolffii]